MQQLPITILITGGGAPGAAGIIKCLKAADRYRILAGDVKDFFVGQFMADGWVKMPAATADNFVEEVLKLCLQNKVRVVLPLVTRELFLFAAAKETFQSHGITVLVSNECSLHLANNKGKLYQTFKNDVFTPAFFIVHSLEELIASAAKLGFPQQPVCMKPCISNGSRGIRIIDEHKDRFHLLFQEKPDSIYTSMAAITETLQGKAMPACVLSEVLPGMEYSVDTLCKNGELLIALPRKRTKMVGGISVEGAFENHPSLIRFSKIILERLKLDGNIGIQFKLDENGEPKLLEINPRVQGTIVTTLAAGINIVDLGIRLGMGEDIAVDEAQIKWGTKFIRFWDEVYYQ